MEPTASPRSRSSTTEEREETITGLKVALNGISVIEDEGKWETKTRRFFQSVYDDDERLGNVVVDVEIRATSVKAMGRARQRRLNGRTAGGNRGLQLTGSSLEVTYTQITKYRNENPDLTINEIVVLPLSTLPLRDSYVGNLKELDGYEQLTEVSEISITNDALGAASAQSPGGDGGRLGIGAIIGIACGGGAFLILLAGFVYYRYRRGGDDDAAADPNATSNILSSTQEDPPSPNRTDASATVDYDYSGAFGGAGAHSLSDVGGTLGSGTRQTAAEDVASGPTSGAPSSQPLLGSLSSIFSDDQTFDRTYEEIGEEILDVYAPAGRLGVVIDTPDDGAPVVHVVKETSPIAHMVQVGDKLVAVDDEDVREMSAITVSKMIGRKSNNASRKLTIMRHVGNN